MNDLNTTRLLSNDSTIGTAAERASEPQPVRPRPQIAAPSIAVVEDDRDVREGWTIYLRYHGYDVRPVADGRAGLRAVLENPPDLVLLDLGLPDLNGLEVIERVRRHGLLVPIVVVTASTSMEIDNEACRLGADVVLQKPVDTAMLLPIFEELIGSGA